MSRIHTMLLTASSPDDIASAGRLLRAGRLVAMPTETVYGLAANALDPAAVARIFEAKGRPADNPLIVHIAEPEDLTALCQEIPPEALTLAQRFWPGPLTLVLPRRAVVPDAVTAGLPTVAVRLPALPAARAVIRAAGTPLAAPSANLAGRPSPTTADHVRADLGGRIDAILDGGPCQWGIESTVVSVAHHPPRLLRPGGVTQESLCDVIPNLMVDPAVQGALADGETPSAPGMKYRHYAPRAPLTILRGPAGRAAAHIRRQSGPVAVLCFDEEWDDFAGLPRVSYGSRSDPLSLARSLFDALRRLDALGARQLFARCPEGGGVEAAVQNRLRKAAGFQTLDV
ncbi:MAG: threonylcarbamoyl-AMP synthase [Oscillospiraceae bacterium]|jgi:L-threonylcarbamoyladenylate synthase|nr:threonylcarbamoyl-AMP synthase [Oscillospiraceae bacterium]